MDETSLPLAQSAPPEAAPAEPSAPGTSRDPAARIRQLTAELKAERAVVEELKGRDLAGKVTQLEDALSKATAASTAWDEEKKSWETERSQWDNEKALLTAGIVDAEGQAVARALYNLQSEEDRGSLAEWLGKTKDAPPAALAPYFGSRSAPPVEAPSPPKTKPAPGTPTVPTQEPSQAQLRRLELEIWASKGPRRQVLVDKLKKLQAQG